MPEKVPPKIKSELPLVVLKGLVMFPKITVPLFLSDQKAIAAIDEALKTDRVLAFAAARKDDQKDFKPEDIAPLGTACRIIEEVREKDGTSRLVIEGLERIKISSFLESAPFFRVAVEIVSQPVAEKTEQIEAQMYSVVSQFKEAVGAGAPVPFDVLLVVMNLTDPWQLGDIVALNMDFRTDEKQKILEAQSVSEKLDLVSKAIARQIKVLNLSKKLQDDTGKELGKMEKEMFLREQLKAIEKELGMVGGRSEIEELRAKIEAAGMPEEVKKTAEKELARMQGMPSFSPELAYIRTYLDWLVSLPWSKKTESKIDVRAARRILDEDHFGLDKVKERIVEYLAVQKLVGRIRGPILCFAGPPGTGKTSIGKSIARALGRKFVRMSLGGVRDEAEIRGFRRTYVGALPGRILQGVAQASTKNPVFMLDEIDKLSSDFRGDPSAALLEALDPEQNYAFSDHYLEAPFDLSDVMFITTANVLESIPPALRDRMEVIDFSGYTESEKLNIGKRHLLPKLFEMHGLKAKQVLITDLALKIVINAYTREAGVRNLERQLATILRKIAREVAMGKSGHFTVGATDTQKYLGPPIFRHLAAEKQGEVGVVNGLAWTETGGEILTIEAAKMPGAGKLILTGHLGQVMQESAQAAFSFARARAKFLGVKEQFHKNSDVHIHVPAGAIPKDGPSAGAAIATALVSLLSDRPVRRGVAMTGEVTLRGRVLEIGGVKEKVLAAHRAGVKTIILPEENRRDLDEVPREIRKSLKFVFAKTMEEVLKTAITARS
jgi:ATP-dependent Lon protease